jgi:hypothetical protein
MTTTLLRRADTGAAGNGGQFAERTHAADTVVLDHPTDRRAAVAQRILDVHSELRILNRSRTPGETVTLSELGDPYVARGNCWMTSMELLENIGAEMGPGGLDLIGMTGRRFGGYHAALVLTDPDGEYVIDYTIRQFNPGLPFPYTGTVPEWAALIGASTGDTWDYDDGHEDEEDDDGWDS